MVDSRNDRALFVQHGLPLDDRSKCHRLMHIPSEIPAFHPKRVIEKPQERVHLPSQDIPLLLFPGKFICVREEVSFESLRFNSQRAGKAGIEGELSVF